MNDVVPASSLKRLLSPHPVPVLFLFLLSLAAFGHEALSQPLPSAGGYFTIGRIEPRLADHTVAVSFTDAVDLDSLRAHLSVIPPVKIDWKNSALSDPQMLVLKADWRPGTRYSLFLPTGFQSWNARLYVHGIGTFVMPQYQPGIAAVHDGSLVERDSRQLVPVYVTQARELDVRLLQVPPIMLGRVLDTAAVASRRSWAALRRDMEETANGLAEGVRKGTFRPFFNPVYEESTSVRVSNTALEPRPFFLPLSFRTGRREGGIFLLNVSAGAGGRTEMPLRVVAITDIGLSYKLSEHGLLVWATSLRTGRPMDEVMILAVTKEGDAVVLGETDRRGVLYVQENSVRDRAVLKGRGSIIRRGLSVSEVRALAAVRDTDRSFIEVLPDAVLATPGIIRTQSDGETGAQPKAMLFTERGIYHPGETVHLKGVVREYRNAAVTLPRSRTVRFRITGPGGAEVHRSEITLSDFGTAVDRFRLGSVSEPGRYTVHLEYGSRLSEQASTSFEVVQPRPARHSVDVMCRPGNGGDGASVTGDAAWGVLECDVAGRYADGGPMKRARITWTVRYRGSEHRRNDYVGFSFGHPANRDDLIASGESVLDERGRAHLSFSIGGPVRTGTYAAEVTASVEDIDGTVASGNFVFQADPEYLVGIMSGPQQAMAGDRRTLHLLVIDRKGKKVGRGMLGVRVNQKIDEGGDDGRTTAPGGWRTLMSSEIPFQRGEAMFAYDVPPGGDSLVSVSFTAPDGKEYASGILTLLPEGHSGRDGGLDAGPSGVLHLYPERSVYKPGERMKVRWGASRRISAALVTVEQNGVLDYGVVELAPGQEMIELPVKDGYGPNVYVSVLATAARTEFPGAEREYDALAPGFLFGTAGIEVNDERARLRLVVQDDAQRIRARPGAEITLPVRVEDEDGEGRAAELAVAVVREDVLAATGFSLPPLERLGRPLMPLGVLTGDARAHLIRQSAGMPKGMLPRLRWTASRGNVPAVSAPVADFTDGAPPVLYYHAALRTDPAGTAAVTFTLPDASVTYRVYVVACDKGSRFGSWEGTIEARKPLSLRAELPAAVTKGDRFLFSLDARNGRDKKSRLGIHLPPEGRIAFSVEDKKHVIGPSEGLRIPVLGRALKAGMDTLRFSGTLDGATDATEQRLPVRTRDMIQQSVLLGSFRREGTAGIELPAAWKERRETRPDPDEVTAALTITGSPYLRLSQAVAALLDDPPGSTIHIGTAVMAVSSLLPEIRNGRVPGVSAETAEAHVRQGLDRLLAMQTASGGFALLQGEKRPHRWATAAAFGALTTARKADIEVPKEQMTKAVSFVQAVTAENRDDDRLVNGYGLYFLALNGYLDRPLLERYVQRIETLPPEAAVLVLAAARSARLMPEDLLRSRLRPLLEASRTAPDPVADDPARLRRAAAALIAASLLSPRAEEAEMLAGELLSSMNPDGAWPSLAGTGWAVYALQEYYRATRTDIRPATIVVRQGDRILDTFLLDPKASRTISLDAAEFMDNPSLTLSSGLETPLLYRLSVAWPRREYGDQGYRGGIDVHKTMVNADGSDRIRQGDVVEVRVRFVLNVPVPRAVLIEDRLPGGLVLMSGMMPAGRDLLQGSSQQVRVPDHDEGVVFMNSGQNAGFWYEAYRDPAGHFRFVPDAVDVRADCVRAFRNATWSGVYEYSYYARAAFEGEFSVPAAKVRLVEDANVSGYSAVSSLTVE